MSNHVDFCICEDCLEEVREAVTRGLVDPATCEASIVHEPGRPLHLQDTFDCTREPGHQGDHGYANVGYAHGQPTGPAYVVRWPRNPGKDRTFDGKLVLEAGEEGSLLPGQPASDFHDVAGANF